MVFFLVPQLCVYKGATAGAVENHVDMNCLEVRITSNSLLDYQSYIAGNSLLIKYDKNFREQEKG